MFRSSMRSSSVSSLFTSLSMLLILKIIKIFKKILSSIVVMWQHTFSMPVMLTVWRRELKFPPYIFEESSNTKFHENPYSWNRVVPSGETNGHRLSSDSFSAILGARLAIGHDCFIPHPFTIITYQSK